MTNYEKVKDLIDKADAIIIGAGSGLSISAGIKYDEENFKKDFPELVSKYKMTDMYTSSYYGFKTEEERFSYWAKHINYIYNNDALDAYKKLFDLVKDKNYFVITTNPDGQFIKSGFDKEKVFEVQGSLSKMQCAVGCHNTLYDILPLVEKMIKYKEEPIPKDLIPKCPICEGRMEVNYRKDAFFVEDDNWINHQKEYQRFVNENVDKNILLIELGVGYSSPGIIRYPFEQLTYNLRHTNLVRVNEKYADVPFEIKLKTVSIKEDISKFIDNLSNM